MENPQAVQPASEEKSKSNAHAEAAYKAFIQQVVKQSGGLLSESEHGKIFSFETYLRERGESAENIQEYCNYLKTSDFAKSIADKNNPRNIKLYNTLNVAFFFFITTLPGLGLYLLVAAFLSTFDISIWSWLPFLLFTFTGPVLLAMVLVPRNLRKIGQLKIEMNNKPQPQYILKYFDNDELTFIKAKSRLFVEK